MGKMQKNHLNATTWVKYKKSSECSNMGEKYSFLCDDNWKESLKIEYGTESGEFQRIQDKTNT